MDALSIASLVVGGIASMSAVIFAYATFKRNNKQDDNSAGVQAGTMMSDIGYIKSGVDDIKRKQEKQDDFNVDMMEKITAAKDSAVSAHKRIDGIEERLSK